MRNSQTPRTDAEAENAANHANIAKGWFVHADFARQLEMELAVAHAKIVRLTAQMETLQASRNFYARRCEALQAVQNKMRDPERTAVCDILANGSTEAMNGAKRPS